jgi:hypothetical protein
MIARLNPDDTDTPNRRVLYAVELRDAVSMERVDCGVSVEAAGLRGKPIMSLSGRFVWLMEGRSWPRSISVVPHPGSPYVAAQEPARPRPKDVGQASAPDRLHIIRLQPGILYPLANGVTWVRGRLTRSASDVQPVADAQVMIDWSLDVSGASWNLAKSAISTTDAQGSFVAYIGRDMQPASDRRSDNGMIKVRLRVLANNVQYATHPNFDFYGKTGPNPPSMSASMIVDGQVLPRDLDVRLDQLERL